MKLSDPWQTFVDKGWEQARLQTGFADEALCPTVVKGRELGDITVGLAFIRLIFEARKGDESYSLLKWIATLMFQEVPVELRIPVLSKLKELDPVAASVVVRFRDDLSDAEVKAAGGK